MLSMRNKKNCHQILPLWCAELAVWVSPMAIARAMATGIHMVERGESIKSLLLSKSLKNLISVKGQIHFSID